MTLQYVRANLEVPRLDQTNSISNPAKAVPVFIEAGIATESRTLNLSERVAYIIMYSGGFA